MSTIENKPLLSQLKDGLPVRNYTTTMNDPESGKSDVVLPIIDRKAWKWTSDSYIWSLTTLILLLVTFSALEYLLLRLTLPAVNP